MNDQRAAWREIASRWCPVGSSKEEEERYINRMLGAIAEAVAQERERCAKACLDVAERLKKEYANETDWRLPYALNRVLHAAWDCESAIRALGEGKT